MVGRTLLILLFFVCAESFGQPQTSTKSLDWTVGDPAKSGFDVAALQQLTRDIKAGKFTNTHAVLIEHDGSLVYEEYFEGTDERGGRSIGKRLMDRKSLHDLRSVSKSVTSALLGIALADKFENDSLKDFENAAKRPIGEYLPDIKLGVPQQAITLHHVLTMTTGLKWNEMDFSYADASNDAIKLYSLRDPSPYVLSRPLANKPGSTWYYNGGCTQVLADVVLKQTGQTLDDFAKEKLFGPLGITNYSWFAPEQWKTGNPGAAATLRLSARDLAKIGSVYLHGGK